jgi:hypothetical protein
MTGSAIRPDDGNWRMLSSREREYLENTESEAKRAGQLGINCEWLIARLDEIHDALCPEHIGTWQSRAQKAVEVAKIIYRRTTKLSFGAKRRKLERLVRRSQSKGERP